MEGTIMGMTKGKPRLQRHAPPKQQRKTHKLTQLVPAVLRALQQSNGTAGFGTAAGYYHVCSCGYETRNKEIFAHHLEVERLMSDMLSFLDDSNPNKTLKHRLAATAKQGKILICSCGRDYNTLTAMQEHIRYVNERPDDERFID